MRNFIYIFLLLLSAGFISCSNEKNENIGTTVFEGNFISKEPLTGTIEELLPYNPAEHCTTLSEYVPYTEEIYDEDFSRSYDRVNRDNYRLSLSTTSAKLQIEKSYTAIDSVFTHTVKNLIFTCGTFDGPVMVWVYADTVRVPTKFRIEEWGATWIILEHPENPQEVPYLPLNNFKYSSYSDTKFLKVENIKSEPEKISLVLNAVTDPNGVVALTSDEYVFNFVPSTGMLTQLKPDYLEIGKLDRVKK